MADREYRFDVVTIPASKRTSQGFLRIDKANLTRTGVLSYKLPDGTTRRELRPPEEVFNHDSLRTLEDAPVTDLHPRRMLGPDNVRKFQRGMVRSAEPDGRFVSGSLLIQDAQLIDAVEAGERKELSPGYTVALDMTPGVFEGQQYDAVQRQIRYNHLATGPKGWGRSGPEVAIRTDSDDQPAPWAVEIREDEGPPATREKKMETITIRIDGVEYKVEASAAPHIMRHLDAITADRDAQRKRADAAEGERDGLKTENASIQKKLDTAIDPKTMQTAIADRVALETAARVHLADETKLDGLTDRQVREAAIAAVNKDVKLDGRTDEYVQGQFDSLPAKSKPQRSIENVRRATTDGKEARTDVVDDPNDSGAARERMMKRNRQLWEGPSN